MDVAGAEHGLGAVPEFGFVEASFDSALAAEQLAGYGRFHSKSFRFRVREVVVNSSNTAETPKDFEFFQ
jgi:hypothetical protein